MAVTLYKSTDASAPVLSGSAGALAGVLDACLVNGYGSQLAAGWTIEYTALNKRVYRPPAGTRLYFRLDDTGTTVGACRGYETMSDIDTGTNGFPASGNTNITKSNAASAAARAWMLVATDKVFYLFVDNSESPFNTGQYQGSVFGDFYSYKSGDAYNCQYNANDLFYQTNLRQARTGAALYGAVARKYDQITIAPSIGRMAQLHGMGNTQGVMGYDTMLYYPESVSGNLLLSPVYMIEYIGSGTGCALRGWLPGIWVPCHALPLVNGDTFVGTTGIANGKTFMVVKVNSASQGTVGQIFLEISDTWFDTIVY